MKFPVLHQSKHTTKTIQQTVVAGLVLLCTYAWRDIINEALAYGLRHTVCRVYKPRIDDDETTIARKQKEFRNCADRQSLTSQLVGAIVLTIVLFAVVSHYEAE